MGDKLFDMYVYLHFAAGIIAYFLGIDLKILLMTHTLFEIIENSPIGLFVINNYLTWWPGGKPKPDTLINSIGDSLGILFGWISAYYVALS